MKSFRSRKESLQPWQQRFITECLHHHHNYEIVRLLLADEVGLGKTLSLGTAVLALCLLSDSEQTTCKSDGLHMIPGKTRDSTGQAMIFTFSPQLQHVLNLSRKLHRRASSMYLFATGDGTR